jgi:hypothetical protein
VQVFPLTLWRRNVEGCRFSPKGPSFEGASSQEEERSPRQLIVAAFSCLRRDCSARRPQLNNGCRYFWETGNDFLESSFRVADSHRT